MRHAKGCLGEALAEAHDCRTMNLLLVQSQYRNCETSELPGHLVIQEPRTYHAVEAKFDPTLSRIEKTEQTASPFQQLMLGKAVDFGLKKQEHHDSAGA